MSVRGTEELVRRLRANIGIGPKKKADVDSMRIISEDIDKIQADISDILSQRTDKAQVKCQLTGKRARLELIINGEPGQTTTVLADLHQAIVGYFKLKL